MSQYIASDPANKICVVMVGLPGRGKSFMTQKLVRYMSWQSIKAKSFNVGTYRRMVTLQPNADFFSNDNILGKKMRKEAAHAAMVDLLNWLFEEDGRVAVFDATNSTKERRLWIKETLMECHVHPLFVETICDDKDVILHTVADVKTSSPDYAGMDPHKAIADFMKRIDQYKSVYETVSSSEGVSYVKIKNIGTQVVVHHIQSYLESHIVYYFMNLHIKPRRLWLSRHGESQFNLTGKLGGDASLTDRGMSYAKKLPSLLKKALGDEDIPLTVWTSTLRRTQQTAQYLPYPKMQWKALDELDAGVCDGLTYEEIEKKYPEDFRNRDENKFEYRYRGGESYRDVTTRLDPVIMELERQENIIIVTHQAVLRCIYAYFMNVPPESSPWLDVPLHTLICLQPGSRGTVETRISADIPAVSTFRHKGEIPKVQA